MAAIEDTIIVLLTSGEGVLIEGIVIWDEPETITVAGIKAVGLVFWAVSEIGTTTEEGRTTLVAAMVVFKIPADVLMLGDIS